MIKKGDTMSETTIKPEDVCKVWEKIIATKGNKGKFVVYTGGPNFANGHRECPNCNSDMERIPTAQPYINVEGGKILVDTFDNGLRLKINRGKTEYSWCCTKCHLSIAGKIVKTG